MESSIDEINSFVLPTDPQLQALLAAMCQRIQALEDETKSLRAELEETQTYTAIERANDRKRLSELEKPGLMPAQKDQREVLRALLVANEGKMLQSQAIKTMRISKSRMSELLTLAKDEIGSKPYHQDKRQNLLFLK